MSFGAVQMLQKSLADAQKDLSSANDAIRKMTGRDPDAPPSRPGPERRTSGNSRMRAWSGDYEAPAAKRRDSSGSRSRLAGRMGPLAGRLGPPPVRWESERRHRDSDGEEMEEKESKKIVLQSSVVATTAPPRPSDTPGDEQSKKRNRRMFGFLMGTLQQFKQSEEAAKKSEKERRRSEIVERVTKMEELEKEAAMLERKELYDSRRSHKTHVARLTRQMSTVEMYTEWNQHDQLLSKYIRTKANPPIFYLPAQHTPETEKLLQATKQSIEEVIAQRNKEIETFLMEEQEEPSTSQPELIEAGGEGGEEGGGEVARADKSMEVTRSPGRRGGRGSGSDSGEASD